MRINKFIALATGMSRRAADDVLTAGRVVVNGAIPTPGAQIQANDTVTLDGKPLAISEHTTTIVLNKPVGYVCSRNGQGSHTVYELLPTNLHHLKPVGRLDKDSSGLLLLTDDGTLAHELTHPSKQKTKVYEISLDTPLAPLHRQMISDYGVELDDGVSRFALERIDDNNDKLWRVRMHEGRNRQIRRTFTTLGYTVTKLHRTHFGAYTLNNTAVGSYLTV